MRSRAAVVAGVFHVNSGDLIDGIHPEVGAVGTAPAKGGDGKPVSLVGDDAHAARLLAGGSSVIDACNLSGFSDYSHFIILFKTAYGITPLKYKKTVLST